jgi:hypothetical protein
MTSTRELILEALNELGVPSSDYPAPVANAVRLLHSAIAIEREKDDLLNWGWTILANVSGGNWENQTEEWQAAVKTWRNRYHAFLDSERIESELEFA